MPVGPYGSPVTSYNSTFADDDMDYLPKLGLEDFKGAGLKKTLRSCAAEAIGTLFLVLIGCGACLNHEKDFVRIALAFGVTVATMAQSIGHVSGCHINPAVTAGLLVGQKIGLVKALLYVVSQCLGAILGAGLLKVFYPSDISSTSSGYLGLTALSKISPGQGFGVEFFITFVLVLVVFGSAADDIAAKNTKGSAPLAIGLSITTCHLYAVPLTGASMNPARTFGPAVIAMNFTNHWVYWLGPILGGICASIVYNMILKAQEEKEPLPEGFDPVATKDVE